MAKRKTIEESAGGTTKFSFSKGVTIWLVVAGLIGLLCSFIIMYDKIQLLKDPNFQPSCNISPLISCGSIMATPQAEAFGFPNPMLGLIGFTAVAVTGFAILAGATFRRWYWLLLNLGLLLAVAFVHWLFFQSVYRIGALCPYCMVVWVMTISTFWYVTLLNLRNGHIYTPSSLKKIVDFVQRHHVDILVVWLLAIAGAILNHFWYYWSTLL